LISARRDLPTSFSWRRFKRDVASELNAPVGPIVMVVKSATIYQTELSLMREVISSAQRTSKEGTSASE
jgi:hypothetical protein